MSKKKVVVIGGGTGTYTVLRGLRKYPLDISVIITMTDSGGSNRVLRDEFGILPTSDIRQCMVALASEDSNDILRQLFTYRYNAGTGIAGMTFGNLFMAALTDIYQSQEEAIEKTCELLGVKGKILPVTYDNTNLVARYDNGREVLGEHYIDEPNGDYKGEKIKRVFVFPRASANPKAIQAIKEADMVVLGPGDLFTSVICNLVVGGIANALNKTSAKVVYVVNLMTKYGQTNEFKASDHLKEIEKYIGRDIVDYCIVNKSRIFPKNLLELYSEESAKPVEDDFSRRDKRIIRSYVSSPIAHHKVSSDKLNRSLIRHDSKKLAKVIYELL